MTAAGMALAGGEVDDAARRPAGSGAGSPRSYCCTSGRTSRTSTAAARSASRSISTSKCPALARIAPSFMRSKCSRRRTRARAGDGDEDVAARRRLQRGHDLEALHPRLQRAHGIDLADDDLRAGAARALGQAAAGPAVAEDDEGLPGEQDVGRAQDAVERRLAGAVVVVEDALGVRLVDRDDRARQPPLGLERAHAQQAGGRLLGAADEPLAHAARERGAGASRGRRRRRG